MNIDELFELFQDRKLFRPKNSYVVNFLKKGKDAILKKIGEEAVEVIIAGKQGDKNEVISEVADLWYNSLLLLLILDLTPQDIYQEFDRRRKPNTQNSPLGGRFSRH